MKDMPPQLSHSTSTSKSDYEPNEKVNDVDADVNRRKTAPLASVSQPASLSTHSREHNHNDSIDNELLILYTSLSSQGTRLLHELTLFQDYLSTPRSPPLNTDIFLARFNREVRREVDVLRRYGRLVSQMRPDHHHRDHQDQIQDQYERADGDDDDDVEKDNNNDPNEEEQKEAETVTEDRKALVEEQGTRIPALHNIRSSNITSYAAIWDEAKRNVGVVALKKKVKYFPPFSASSSALGSGSCLGLTGNGVGSSNRRGGRGGKGKGKETVMVDVVADHGRKWVKVWTKSQEWLQMDMAKEGLVGLDEQDWDQNEDEDNDKTRCVQDSEAVGAQLKQRQKDLNEFRDLKLVKMACEFVAAAKTTRIDHRHPKVHFILPKVQRGRSRDVDIVLMAIEQIGIVVSCFGESDLKQEQSGSTLVDHFDRMLAEPRVDACPNAGLLNLDCTVLIALISDISHFWLKSTEVPNGVEIPAHYHGQTRCDIVDQFLSDQQRPLLPDDVYPILSGKQLLCTSVAANHLRKIVQLMGTATEMLRADILLGNLDGEHARNEWNKLSIHGLGDTIKLPVQVLEFDKDQALKEIGRQSQISTGNVDFEIARRISSLETRQLSDLNKAVFIHGWSSRVTTFTLNRVVSGFIQRAIDDCLDVIEVCGAEEDASVEDMRFWGPRLEVCARERSLIGSDKTCRNK